jgi:hypothetical protein
VTGLVAILAHKVQLENNAVVYARAILVAIILLGTQGLVGLSTLAQRIQVLREPQVAFVGT